MVDLIDQFRWMRVLLLIESRRWRRGQDDEPEGQKGGRIELNELERTTTSAQTCT